MGGKTTLLRSTCLAVVMAQVGCYVAASSAVLEPVDAVYTRIGAADAIMCGLSTFMVEMTETAASLAAATPSSLIVLDELGRGTSTHDAYALALTSEPQLCGFVQNCHMSSALDAGHGQLMHLYELKPGAAPTGSCGIEESPETRPWSAGKTSEMADMGIKYKEEEALKGVEQPHNVEEVLAHLHDPGRKGTEEAQKNNAYATTAAEDPPVEAPPLVMGAIWPATRPLNGLGTSETWCSRAWATAAGGSK
eukprot:gene9343-9506_t